MQKAQRLICITGMAVALASCGSQHSNRPLLSVAPSAAADNDVYVADQFGRIRALRSDGSEQWNISLPDEMLRLDPSASHDLRIDLLAARSGGKIFGLATQLSGPDAGGTILFALDANRLAWQVAVPYPEQNGVPIAIGANAVYEAAQDGALYAYGLSDGKRLWEYQVAQGALSSPIVGADGTIYVTGPNYNLHAVSPDGKQRWILRDAK
jgi:outer membrane protein assembly factor BamB